MKEKDVFTNRELSWLAFNERVLDEAANENVPLAERLSFLSIYQSNLDEFFMVRVGTLMTQMGSKEVIRENKTRMSSEEQVNSILRRVNDLEKKKNLIYQNIMCKLEANGVRIINFNKLSTKEGALLEKYFDQQIAPFLSPIIVGKQHPFPFLANKQLFAVILMKSQKGKTKLGVVPCSNSVFQRLIEIPTRPGVYMLSEELILHFVSKLYAKYTICEKAIIRVTRNADISEKDLYDEDLDYRDVMGHLIKRRNRLSPVRVEYSRDLNRLVRVKLAEYLDIDEMHLVKVSTPLDFSFVGGLQRELKKQPELFYDKRTPAFPASINAKQNMMEQIEKKDLLLSYPFESMKPFVKLLEEAAEDPKVVSIKMTLYRVADKGKIIDALIDAAENGKEVVVLVELRARFDEMNNIELSKRLEDAGCQIQYGLEDYKVHSKLCLITCRQENGELEYITQIGTGNYNEKTSLLYTDFSLMTANYQIGKEVAAIFLALQKGEVVEASETLMVAPKCLQNRLIELIREQIRNKEAGKEAYIGIKVNSMTDKVLIDELIKASKAGVKIELIVRGICCVKPGVEGFTENITVISIVGRYLEHSRIYRFGVGGDEKVYISSADFMTRNTTRRVEAAVPILDADVRKKITTMFDLMLQDDAKGKVQNSEGKYVGRNINETPLDSQMYFYDHISQLS